MMALVLATTFYFEVYGLGQQINFIGIPIHGGYQQPFPATIGPFASIEDCERYREFYAQHIEAQTLGCRAVENGN
jgi:hypothetical protein